MFLGYLKLMRPANILTAMADIMLGFAASGAFALAMEEGGLLQSTQLIHLLWLLLATSGLYGGGVVFNDIFDAELDAKERPERPIPSGDVPLKGAVLLALSLYIIGILAAFQVNFISGFIAIIIAALATLYDRFSKHNAFLGPLNMGLCRAANLLLGISVMVSALHQYWFLALIPLVYIAAITIISRSEVYGGSRPVLIGALCLYTMVFAAIASLALLPGYEFLQALPFMIFFAYRILVPFFRAFIHLKPDYIMKAVKAGVLSLIVLNATIAAGFAGWMYGIVVLLLLPLSGLIAKTFSVT